MARASRLDSRFDTGLFIACVFLAIVAHGLPAHLREPIAATMRRTIVAPLVALQHNAELSRAAWLAHESNTRMRDSLSLQAMRVNSLEKENERFRRLLGLGSELRWGFVPAEALHSGAVGDEWTLTLSAGSRQKVTPFSPVVAPEGLVGMVQTVDPRMSIAIMWTHPDFRVSAMAADGSAFGIAQAHQGSGADRYLLELRGVPLRNQVKRGTLIVSSGLGGVYPKGIPIGTVIDTLRSDGYARKYLLRPAVLPPDVLSVMILQPDRGQQGVSGVWAGQVAQADSISRAAASIDSAARASRAPAVAPVPAPTDSVRPANADSVAAAAAAARARRARRDSIRADSVRRARAADSATPRRDTARPDTARRDTTAPVVPPVSPAPAVVPPR
ncbi:MAG TPA: rod shape-determining protein MreC [Gemmatimonadaceae bacterium]|nr:rod shape-determining protein MreC [Gemmatimonadaceae bacterium]